MQNVAVEDRKYLYKSHPIKEVILIVIGALLFSASMNWIVLPCGMYSGGFLGFAQLFRMLLLYLFPSLQQSGDLAGIIYFLMNIPLLIISWHRFGRSFFSKTIICIIAYSLFLAILPIPHNGLFEEQLTACVIGGILCGFGAALPLTAGCSGGGEEIVGILFSQKNASFSVGKLAIILNFVLYGIGLLLFDYEIVLYSIIFSCVTYLTLDRIHLQNVMVTMLIITKSKDMEQLIFSYVGRGVTKWSGVGAYSKEPYDILMTAVSKKEALILRSTLQKFDPSIFLIITENVSVVGNFSKKLWN